ncbi:hypothetical protein DFA_04057 [Cavenderia fasciculata]|uniref:Uncharacterized protein n=1 Tax=Cavenderia fasciculata TaxID=261658 RepID=F4Q162_CACFS|nr:uncharacterized protein DFA_04057 [Cavenderia fasciculata]EGG18563.1 hypothetical protein DFA_04057 [Cavenderia fasciculata]|eukprot:XP_004366467.1 hypothetical protein DFA_04057 [Cavenderia fasciculata]
MSQTPDVPHAPRLQTQLRTSSAGMLMEKRRQEHRHRHSIYSYFIFIWRDLKRRRQQQ